MRTQIAEWVPFENGAKLIRLWGDSPAVSVPEKIEGLPVVAVGARCFAASEPVIRGQKTLLEGSPDEALVLQAGRYLESVALPPTVRLLENAAFYDCRNLKILTFYPALQEFGSDLFLNCRSLHTLKLSASPSEPTGLRKILASLSWEIRVLFEENGVPVLHLLYPEFDEGYDENTPAHIFNLHISGEGYRYRQCFQKEILNLTEYDAIFPQAAVSESPAVLNRLALGRLRTPLGLSDPDRLRYQEWLKTHLRELWPMLIADQELEALHFLTASRFLTADNFRQGAALAADQNWSEGAALLLSASRPKVSAPRYSFDEFVF